MPMASQDPLPQAIDFLSQCESCHKMVSGDLWFQNGEYVCTECFTSHKKSHKCLNYHKVELTYSASQVKWKSIRGWTRWYGANNNLFLLTQEWFCQSCGEQQTDELPSYLIRIQDQEYARICSVCLHVALERKISNLSDLMVIQHPCFD